MRFSYRFCLEYSSLLPKGITIEVHTNEAILRVMCEGDKPGNAAARDDGMSRHSAPLLVVRSCPRFMIVFLQYLSWTPHMNILIIWIINVKLVVQQNDW